MRTAALWISVIIFVLGLGGFLYWKYFTGGPTLTVSQPPSLPSAGRGSQNLSGGNVSFSNQGGQLPAGQSISSSAGALAVVHASDRLTRIAVGPVVPGEAVVDISGQGSVGSTTASSTIATGPDVSVEFIERQSGNIFSYLVHAGVLTRTSNKTLPGIEAAHWLPSGGAAFVTYLSDDLSTVNTYGLASDGSGGFFLPSDLADLAVSSTSVLALASGASGSVASLMKPDGTGSSTVWSSPLSALRVGLTGKGGIAFTKPTESLPGYVFAISSKGVFTRLAGPLLGLVALPDHKGANVLVSSAAAGVMSLMLVNQKTGEETALPIATIADKCVWTADDTTIYCGVPVAPSTDYSYPDDWYQGAVHFSDRIWRIDLTTRVAQMVFDPSTTSLGALDAEALAVDPEGTTLVFVNKNDGSLWSYAL